LDVKRRLLMLRLALMFAIISLLAGATAVRRVTD